MSPIFSILFEPLMFVLAAMLVLLLITRIFSKRIGLRICLWVTLILSLLAIVPALRTVSHRALIYPKLQLPNSLTIMSYNTHQMAGAGLPEQNRVIDYIRRTNADIVCLQEVEVHKDNHHLTLTSLKQALSMYPYTYFDFKVYNSRRQYGNAVFSRYPLIDKHTLRYESRGNITSVCDIVLPNDTIRLYTNHLESNRLSRADIDEEHLSASSELVKSKLNSAASVRAKQAEALRNDITQAPYKVIVAGDFNDTPASYTYHLIQHGLKDAFLESSNLELGHTFTMYHLGVRIDYILHSPEMSASHFRIDQVDYSDHYPILTTIHY